MTNRFQKFTVGQSFTTKAKNFSEYVKISNDLSKPSSISQGTQKDAGNKTDRNPKQVVAEGRYKTIGEGQVFLNESCDKIQYRLPKGMNLKEYKEKYKSEIAEFIKG